MYTTGNLNLNVDFFYQADSSLRKRNSKPGVYSEARLQESGLDAEYDNLFINLSLNKASNTCIVKINFPSYENDRCHIKMPSQ